MQTIKNLSNKNFYLIIGFLWSLFSFLSYRLLPSMPIVGADISMQYFFHKCLIQDPLKSIYTVSGSFCNDQINLFYAYPPTIFRFFSYSQFITDYNLFYYLYTVFVCICIFYIPLIIKSLFKSIGVCFTLLCSIFLLMQAPSYFSIERGGTDIIFTIPWVIASLFFLNNKYALAAFLMCLSVLLKLYPAIAVLCVVLSFIHSKKYLTKDFYIFALSGVISAFLFILIDLNLWIDFFMHALPKANSMPIGTNVIGHSLIGPFNKFFVYFLLIYFCYFFSKLIASSDKNIKALGLFSAIGFSTYFNNHSFDYNLVTIYPLFIFLLFSQVDNKHLFYGNKYFSLALILLLLTIFGPSNLVFSFHKYAIKFKLLLHLLSFQLIYFGYKLFLKNSNKEQI